MNQSKTNGTGWPSFKPYKTNTNTTKLQILKLQSFYLSTVTLTF